MKTYRLLACFLVASAFFLSVGAAILRIENLVPTILTATTTVVILLILLLSFFVWHENEKSVIFGAILAVVSIIFNTAQPQHLEAILHPFTSVEMTVLVTADILGFYVMPILYLLTSVIKRKALLTRKKLE